MTTPTPTAPTAAPTAAPTTTAHAPTVQAPTTAPAQRTTTTAPAKADALDLDTPPELDPRGLDLTADELDQARELLAAWWETEGEERRGKLVKRLQKQRKARDLVKPRARAIAARFAVLVSSMRPTLAAAEIGMDIKRDWGPLFTAISCDPLIDAIYQQARRASGKRITSKAEDVAERAMDGERVTQAQERLASLALERLDRERWGQEQRTAATTAPTTAAAQVVINLGGTEAAKSCCNLLQRARDGVING